jgi:hypothetical protein
MGPNSSLLQIANGGTHSCDEQACSDTEEDDLGVDAGVCSVNPTAVTMSLDETKRGICVARFLRRGANKPSIIVVKTIEYAKTLQIIKFAKSAQDARKFAQNSARFIIIRQPPTRHRLEKRILRCQNLRAARYALCHKSFLFFSIMSDLNKPASVAAASAVTKASASKTESRTPPKSHLSRSSSSSGSSKSTSKSSTRSRKKISKASSVSSFESSPSDLGHYHLKNKSLSPFGCYKSLSEKAIPG